MKKHQTNEVTKSIIKKLIVKHKDSIPPWKPRCNTHIGKWVETELRLLHDQLVETTDQKQKDFISAKINALNGVYYKVAPTTTTGPYCLYCGWLHQDETVFDGKFCCKCDSLLPRCSTPKIKKNRFVTIKENNKRILEEFKRLQANGEIKDAIESYKSYKLLKKRNIV